MQSLAIYIHWPFCKKKCPYCDFNSHVREHVDHARWARALLRELGYWHSLTSHQRVSSVFFGGGTPSLMNPETINQIIGYIIAHWETDAGLEITMEANPTSVEMAKFKQVAAAGVNRLSLGVQSLRPAQLEFLGREHSAHEALDAVALAAQIFPRYSFDLIYGLPGQSVADWRAELAEALLHARGHMSLYQLTIEPNTAFHHAYHVAKAFHMPEEGLAATLYNTTQEIMTQAGMPAYEISNHAAKGQESLHNLAYWRSQPYLGVGPGAHGRVAMPEGRVATATIKSPERWQEAVEKHGHGLEVCTPLSPREQQEEQLLMGMRLVHEGVDMRALGIVPGHPHLVMLVQQGLVRHAHERLYATPGGALVLNAVIEKLAGIMVA